MDRFVDLCRSEMLKSWDFVLKIQEVIRKEVIKQKAVRQSSRAMGVARMSSVNLAFISLKASGVPSTLRLS